MSDECISCDCVDTHTYDFYPNSEREEQGRVSLCDDCYTEIQSGDYPQPVQEIECTLGDER
jgi:hypothetical protein